MFVILRLFEYQDNKPRGYSQGGSAYALPKHGLGLFALDAEGMEKMSMFSNWLNDRPYTKAMYLTASASLAMAVTSGIMSYTIIQNARSLRLTEESVRLARESISMQATEFRFRHRPVITFANPRFAGSCTDGLGRTWPFSIALDIRNASDIPATHVFAETEISVNGSGTVGSKIDAGVIVKGDPLQSTLFLTKDLYESATNHCNRFEVHLQATYSGMLGEKKDDYKSTLLLRYYPKETRFGYSVKSFR